MAPRTRFVVAATLEAQARQLSRRLFTAQEDERRRIARELHDGANQEIALFALQLDRSGYDVLAERARALATDLHRLSQRSPAILDQLGLVQALQQFGDQLRQGRGLTVEVRASKWPSTCPRRRRSPSTEWPRKRCRTSPGTAAPGKRSSTCGARRPSVDDHRRPRRRLRATPDGAARLGLAGMQERLRGIGGPLSVETARAKGTRVVAQIPREALAAFEGAEATPPSRRRACQS